MRQKDEKVISVVLFYSSSPIAFQEGIQELKKCAEEIQIAWSDRAHKRLLELEKIEGEPPLGTSFLAKVELDDRVIVDFTLKPDMFLRGWVTRVEFIRTNYDADY